MTAAPEGGVHSFLLKVWFEPSESSDEEPEWRGEVKHLLSGETVHFRRLTGISGAVEDALSRTPEPPDDAG